MKLDTSADQFQSSPKVNIWPISLVFRKCKSSPIAQCVFIYCEGALITLAAASPWGLVPSAFMGPKWAHPRDSAAFFVVVFLLAHVAMTGDSGILFSS